MTNTDISAQELPPKGRLIWGGALFVFGFVVPPLFIPVVAASGLPGGWKAAISGLLMLGVPELFMIIAAAVLGKAGFEYLKGLIFRFLKRHALPESVSPTRYYIGLILFLIPLFVGWAAPYASYIIPELITHKLILGIAGDLILIVSLFVLGGEFWDKLRSLFFHDAKVEFPVKVESKDAVGIR